MKNLILSGLLFAQTAVLAQVPPLPTSPTTNSSPVVLKLAWDASPDSAATNYHYRLYANLGSSLVYTNRTNATVIVPLGKNVLGAQFSDLREGRWHFVVTALNTNFVAESGFSNEVVFERPAPPAGLRSVAVEYTSELPSGWQTTGFFRIKVLP